MSYGEAEPSEFHRGGGRFTSCPRARVTFDRRELKRIFVLYGRKVAAGEWRDYAIDFLRDRAVFSVFRRTSEIPIYRIEKIPKLAHRQGAYSVISATGLILRRGHELDRVLGAIDTFDACGSVVAASTLRFSGPRAVPGAWLRPFRAGVASARCPAIGRT